jgi:calpain
MNFEDFYQNYNSIQFCHISPDSYSDEILRNKVYNSKIKIRWNTISMHGKWEKNKSAGGAGNFDDERYWSNPQYLIKLVDVDFEDNENLSTLIVALMQKYNREKRNMRNGQLIEDFIQFRVFKCIKDDEAEFSLRNGVKMSEDQLERVGNSGSYVNKREVTTRFRLEPGYYLIIPSTFEHGIEGEFLLRFFTEASSEINYIVNNRAYALKNQIESDYVKKRFTGNSKSSSYAGMEKEEKFANSIEIDRDNIKKEEFRFNTRPKSNLRRFFGL